MREVTVETLKFLLQQAKTGSDPTVYARASELLERVERAEAEEVVHAADVVATIRKGAKPAKDPEGAKA